MILKSPYEPHEIAEILKEQVASIPTYREAFKFRGTSLVCGIVDEKGFKLQPRLNTLFSLTAYGEFVKSGKGTVIKVRFEKPSFPNSIIFALFNRYDYDRNTVIGFLKEWIKIGQVNEKGGGAGVGAGVKP